jgi:hypothetical protein
MGSPPVPHLANGWVSQYDDTIKGNARLCTSYMDDILQNIKHHRIEDKPRKTSNLHPSLKVTNEGEVEGAFRFLDVKVIRVHGSRTSTWYNKPNTGLIMNCQAWINMWMHGCRFESCSHHPSTTVQASPFSPNNVS